MRIAVIVGGFPLLSETFVLVQITGLLDRGHEVHIFSRRPPQGSQAHPDVERYDLLSRLHSVQLPQHRLGRILRATPALLSGLRRSPLAVMRCLNVRRYGSIYAALNNVIFLDAFAGHQYDAILCHFGGNGIDFIGIKEASPDVRFVTMFHGDDLSIGDEQGVEVFSALKTYGDSYLVTTNCYGRATLRRYGFSDDRIITHRLGVAVKQIAFRERSMTNAAIRILTVGRLVPVKGIDVGIHAVATLQRANPGLRLEYNIIGDGPLRNELSALVRKLDADSFITLRGALPSPAVMKWMQDSDIYVLPSKMEGGGVVLLEAQASGLPVVAARVGGVPEMVREDRSAVLISPDDTDGFAQGLQMLLDEPERWPLMGREGRAHVEANHDIDVLNDELEQILKG